MEDLIWIHHNRWWWGQSWAVALYGGKALGHGSIMSDEKEEMFISSVSTYKLFRGQGYATRVLRTLEDLAIDKGCERTALYVDKDKPENMEFYQKRGYVLDEKYEDTRVYRLTKTL